MRRSRTEAWTTLAASGLILIGGATAGRGADSCKQTAQYVLRSCQEGADDEYQLALGRCENLRDAVARRAAAAGLKASRTSETT